MGYREDLLKNLESAKRSGKISEKSFKAVMTCINNTKEQESVWVQTQKESSYFNCKKCGVRMFIDRTSPYCPCCGRKMTGRVSVTGESMGSVISSFE